MADIDTINRAIAFVDSMENAIEEKGVEVPDGTVAEDYDEYVEQIAGSSGVVDQTYKPESRNAQSGISVAEALLTKLSYVECSEDDIDKCKDSSVFYKVYGFDNQDIEHDYILLYESRNPIVLKEEGYEVLWGTQYKFTVQEISRRHFKGKINQELREENWWTEWEQVMFESDSPIKTVTSPDSNGNVLDIYSMESGTYLFDGRFRPYPEATSYFTFSSGQLVAIRHGSVSTVAQVFYPPNNAIQYLDIRPDEISETGYSYTRQDAKLVNMESVTNKVTTIDENSDDEHYPSALAVKTYADKLPPLYVNAYVEDKDWKIINCDKKLVDIEEAFFQGRQVALAIINIYRSSSFCACMTEIAGGGIWAAFELTVDDCIYRFRVNGNDEWRTEVIEIAQEVDLSAVSNTVKGIASGEVVRVDDVSPIEHTAKAKVSGKNLFNQSVLDMPTSAVVGVTITYLEEEGCFLINGTATTTSGLCATYINLLGKKNNNYTITSKYVSGEVSVPTGQHAVGYFGSSDTENKSVNWLAVKLENSDYSVTKELTDKYITRFWFYFTTGVTFVDYKVKIQLEQSDIASEFVPYIDPSTVTVTRCGKNLIPYPLMDTGVTRWGITVTDNGDGVITLNGTAEMTTSFTLFQGAIPVNGTYTISGMSGGSGTTYYIQPYCTDKAYGGLTSGSKTYEWTDNTLERILLTVAQGTTLSNLKISLMLEKSDTATDYEPYKAVTDTPNADGTLEITSLFPTMTLLTDTAGVNIDLEYNQDTNKVVGTVKEDIKTLDNDMAELKNDMGDVDTALDNIIAIQNTLIGGEGA